MAQINSIGAGMFTDMSVHIPSIPLTSTQLATKIDKVSLQALFVTQNPTVGGTTAADTFTRIENIRDFPALGTPANIVNVAAYGSKTSQQVQGQADAPSIELTLNYVPADWAVGTLLGDAVGNGVQYIFRAALLNSEPLGYDSNAIPANGIGSVPNSQYYWVGKIEALQVNAQLTDSNTATVTISVQSDFFGAFTE